MCFENTNKKNEKTNGEISYSCRELAGHPVHDDNDELLRANGEARSTQSLWGMPRENVILSPRPTTVSLGRYENAAVFLSIRWQKERPRKGLAAAA